MRENSFISKPLIRGPGLAACLVLFVIPGIAAAQNEWLTWGHDPERTGSNPDEKILNKDNVSRLEVKWTAQISTASEGIRSLDDDGSRGRHGEHAAGAGRARFRGRQRQHCFRDRCGYWQNGLAKGESEHHQGAQKGRLPVSQHAKCHPGDRQRGRNHLCVDQRWKASGLQSAGWRRPHSANQTSPILSRVTGV